MPDHRILLYGASNLWLSRRFALTELRKRFPGELEIGLANGPGRSYGLRAGNPLIRYEPLSEVVFDFGSEVKGSKIAFITDVGNDIAYSQEPNTVIHWVKNLANRLEQDGYQVIMGGLPVESLAKLHPRVFNTVARLYYSEASVSQLTINQRLFDLEDGLRELCVERGYKHHPLLAEWYSYDNFHLTRRARSPYWQNLLARFPVVQNFNSTLSVAVRQPLFPRHYWALGREFLGRGQYRNLVPGSVTLVR